MKTGPQNLNYKHFKTGTLFISCKGSHQVAWIGSKFYPVKPEEIPSEVDHFCKRCEVSECPRKAKVESAENIKQMVTT